MSLDDAAPPSTASAPSPAIPAIRRALDSVRRFWSDRETPLPQPIRWWRAL